MATLTQLEKGQTFRALHERDSAFIIPNPWDAGAAKLLAHLGFEALATTSAGYAFSAGQPDNAIDRDEMMAVPVHAEWYVEEVESWAAQIKASGVTIE